METGGRYHVDYAKMPTAIERLAKELLEQEATGDRARAEAWFKKYDRMPRGADCRAGRRPRRADRRRSDLSSSRGDRMTRLRCSLLAMTITTMAVAASAQNNSTPTPTPAPKPAPKAPSTVTVSGCVGGGKSAGDPYTITSEDGAIAYKLSGKNMRQLPGPACDDRRQQRHPTSENRGRPDSLGERRRASRRDQPGAGGDCRRPARNSLEDRPGAPGIPRPPRSDERRILPLNLITKREERVFVLREENRCPQLVAAGADAGFDFSVCTTSVHGSSPVPWTARILSTFSFRCSTFCRKFAPHGCCCQL